MSLTTGDHNLDVKRIAAVVRDPSLSSSVSRLRRALGKGAIDVRLVPEAICIAGADPAASGEFEIGWMPDAVLALGGDGTVLRALNAFPGVPVLAVNYGHLGFLTAGDEKDLERMIFRLLSGDFMLDERMMIRAELRGQSFDVVNEVVVKGITNMVTIDIFIDGALIRTLRGDGVAVGTPTGSTAYLLSTGAPIVTPGVECLLLAGINEFSYSSRPLVVEANREIKLRVNEATREREIFVSHDGRDRHPVQVGDEIVARRNEKKARLIFFEDNYFFKNLKARLNW
jgi:NAD+ kinase